MFDLTGKTALVTGATGGIGAEIARAFHAQGARVALSGTREAVLQDLAAEFGDEVRCADAIQAAVDSSLYAATGHRQQVVDRSFVEVRQERASQRMFRRSLE